MATPTDKYPRTTLPPALPRVTITYCTQCRWLLRAAYFAQELLSTFQDDVTEVSLRPATGGLFRVVVSFSSTDPAGAQGNQNENENEQTEPRHVLVWDRKSEGGFPETKVLKQRVRDVIAPGRGLGHSDAVSAAQGVTEERGGGKEEGCEDCK